MIQPPEDIESERSLLATLSAPGAEGTTSVLLPSLQERDFIHPAHKAILSALRALVERGDEINSLALKAELEDQKTLNRVGGFQGLIDILGAEEVGRPEALIKIIQTKRKQRDLQILGAKLQNSAGEMEPDALISEISSELTKLALTSDRGEPKLINLISDEALTHLVEKVEGLSVVGTKFHSWPRLNGLTHGFQPGQLIVLAARPGVGKTALAQNWTLRAGMYGKRCLYISLEMSSEELWNRIVSDKSGISAREIVKNHDQEGLQKFAEGSQEVNRLPLHISDAGRVTVAEIKSHVDRLIARHGSLDLVVIDYLQLLTSVPGTKNQSETTRVGDITRALKILARDAKVPILLLSQLNRDVEKRGGNGIPQLSDLRDSGCIEQDADIVMFISRDMKETTAGLTFAKHRNGPCMTLPMEFKSDITRYVELERETDPYPGKPIVKKNKLV
jgi:replicative DNA helicase